MTAVLFDLGNTLVAHYHREEFRPILERSIANVVTELEARGIPAANRETLLVRAVAANRERDDFRFSPMIKRLAGIFELPPEIAAAEGTRLCAAFLEPIFATGRVYDDARATLTTLAQRGHPTGIVSNAPWGSPPELWRAELARAARASPARR
jgi:FMN phosphatase YigB (HAD superfamily)